MHTVEFSWVGDVMVLPSGTGRGLCVRYRIPLRSRYSAFASGIVVTYVVDIQSVGSFLCTLITPFLLHRWQLLNGLRKKLWSRVLSWEFLNKRRQWPKVAFSDHNFWAFKFELFSRRCIVKSFNCTLSISCSLFSRDLKLSLSEGRVELDVGLYDVILRRKQKQFLKRSCLKQLGNRHSLKCQPKYLCVLFR